jgi:hypothetical protein
MIGKSKKACYKATIGNEEEMEEEEEVSFGRGFCFRLGWFCFCLAWFCFRLVMFREHFLKQKQKQAKRKQNSHKSLKLAPSYISSSLPLDILCANMI